MDVLKQNGQSLAEIGLLSICNLHVCTLSESVVLQPDCVCIQANNHLLMLPNI